MSGLRGQVREPGGSARARRNSQNLASNVEFIGDNEVIVLNGDGELTLTLASAGGLANVSNELTILLNPTNSGLALTSAGIAVNLATDPGLEFDSNALRVLANTSAGIERTSSGIGVDLAADPGLEFDGTNGLRALVGDGLERVAGGIQIDLATNSGLEFNSGDLQIDVADSSLTLAAAGISVNHWEGGHWNMRSTQNTTTTPAEGDFIPVDTSGGAFSCTLPTISATNDGRSIAFKKISADATNITINRGGTDTIDGATSLVFNSQWQLVVLTAHNGNGEWYVWAQL